jgi:hypothetical protein
MITFTELEIVLLGAVCVLFLLLVLVLALLTATSKGGKT